MKRLNPRIPLYILVNKLSHQGLRTLKNDKNGAEIVFVENPVERCNLPQKKEKRSGTYTKLALWNQTFVDKGVYLDVDTLPLRSLEPLFEELNTISHFGLAISGSRAYFNSGVFTFFPDIRVFENMIATLKARNYTALKNPTEQDLLFSVFGHLPSTHFLPANVWNCKVKRTNNCDTKNVLHWAGGAGAKRNATFDKPWSLARLGLGKLKKMPGFRYRALKKYHAAILQGEADGCFKASSID